MSNRRIEIELAYENVFRVYRTHPFPRRRRHTSHRRVQAIQMPMLIAEIARNDSTMNVRVRRLTAVVTDDRLSVLVLESITISIFLSNSSSAEEMKREIGLETFPMNCVKEAQNIRDLRRRTMFIRIDELAIETDSNYREKNLLLVESSVGELEQSKPNLTIFVELLDIVVERESFWVLSFDIVDEFREETRSWSSWRMLEIIKVMQISHNSLGSEGRESGNVQL